MEGLQTEGRVICLNSKVDFIKPFKTTVTIQNGNLNDRPGVENRQKKRGRDREEDRPNKKARQTNTEVQTLVRQNRCSTPDPDATGVINIDLSKIMMPQEISITQEHQNNSAYSRTVQEESLLARPAQKK